MTSFRKVLAIGLDSAALPLIERLVVSGRMPAMGKLFREGRRSEMTSPSAAGSGGVWPTFVTGTPSEIHGRYSEWPWQPDIMNVRRIDSRGLVPFWLELCKQGARVLSFDVPFSPPIETEGLFQILEWGPHDVEFGTTRVWPPSLETLLREMPQHPYRFTPASRGPEDGESVRRVVEASISGATLRGEIVVRLLEEIEPDLALVVFPELHHAGHDLWHTVEPDHANYAFPRYQVTASMSPNLLDVYEAVDEQLGRIFDAVGPNTTVVVFALHGLYAGPGVVTMLRSILERDGFVSPSRLRSLGWSDVKGQALRRIKRAAPGWMASLYKQRVDRMTRIRSASSTIFEVPDWTKTRVFGLPDEWHGYGRVNLAGREARGIVPVSAYDQLRSEIKERVDLLRDVEGRSVVNDVYLPSADPMQLRIPDVIVHWSSLAHLDSLELAEGGAVPPRVAVGRTGEHTIEAFCLSMGPYASRMPDETDATELARHLTDALIA